MIKVRMRRTNLNLLYFFDKLIHWNKDGNTINLGEL